jgi:hypothetical protein
MVAHGDPTAREILEKLKPELERAFSYIPRYGSIGIIAHFVRGQIARVEISASVARKLADDERGDR